jgi:YfiH family protein
VRIPNEFIPSLTPSHGDGLWFLHDQRARGWGVAVVFTGRRGGVSSGPFATLNLSVALGDDPSAVEENRARVAAPAGIDPERIVAARQVHSATVLHAASIEPDVHEADAILATDPSVVPLVQAADCAPIAIAASGGVVMAHAGRRGLAGGVIDAAVGAAGGDAVAWVGPCIRGCCYEVGPEVIEDFVSAGLPVTDDRHVDIGDAAAHALRRAGVDRIAVAPWCTACEPNLFFSHRREGLTGRQGGYIAMTA